LAACGSSDSEDGGSVKEEPYLPPAPDACITDVTPGHQSLTCEGLSFELTVPATCLTERCGFIVDVHGFAMSGALEELHTLFQTKATAQGYIVLQPSAPGAVLQSAWSSANDDAVFALMNHVRDVWHVDAKRIHFGGYSMGSWMTWRFICKHADVIASAAPIAGGAQPGAESCAFTGDQMPVREIPIFYTHGRQDGLVNFSTAIQQRDAVIAAWNLTQTEVVGQASDYEWDRYKSPKGTVFEFAQHDWLTAFKLGSIELKGHCFPGSDAVVGCGLNTAFVWGDEVLKFYKAHPMP
jgi:poly(3-hydroxybutyrate) depolymerase